MNQVWATRRRTRSILEEHIRREPQPAGFDVTHVNMDTGSRWATEVQDQQIAVIAEALHRPIGKARSGAVLLRDLRWPVEATDRHEQHGRLFDRIWQMHRRNSSLQPLGKISDKLIDDGKIPVELYGSPWTFKSLHADSRAYLFSHLFGPLAGYSGGNIILVDMRAYLSNIRLTFDEIFEWGAERNPGAKPTVRSHHAAVAVEDFGVDLGPLKDGDVLIINNSPEAAIFHAATPLKIEEPALFDRRYHRCRVVL